MSRISESRGEEVIYIKWPISILLPFNFLVTPAQIAAAMEVQALDTHLIIYAIRAKTQGIAIDAILTDVEHAIFQRGK